MLVTSYTLFKRTKNTRYSPYARIPRYVHVIVSVMYFYIQSLWLIMLQSKPRVSVWVCVCMCVCVWKLYSQNGCVDFDKTLHKGSDRHLLVSVFSIFENSNLMTSWRPFCTFPMGHSHGRNFCPIFFKFEYKVKSFFQQFSIENQQNRVISIDVITDRVFEDIKNGRQKLNFQIQTSEVSIYIIIHTCSSRILYYFIDQMST